MSSEKFTQGEWRAEIEDHSFCDTGDYITEFGVVTGKRQSIAQCFDFGSINEEEAAANCYLIAAAPDMYRMLQIVHGVLGGGSLPMEIEKVLKKARGEE